MKILGIDPGYGRCGFGVIEKNGQNFILIEYGCIETSKDLRLGQRLLQIDQALTELIKKHQPDMAGVEELFFAKNVKTAMAVAEARGVVMLVLQKAGLNVKEFKPVQIKQALTGYGNSDKKAVQTMVKITLKLAEIPKSDDAADALAVAITTATWQLPE